MFFTLAVPSVRCTRACECICFGFGLFIYLLIFLFFSFVRHQCDLLMLTAIKPIHNLHTAHGTFIVDLRCSRSEKRHLYAHAYARSLSLSLFVTSHSTGQNHQKIYVFIYIYTVNFEHENVKIKYSYSNVEKKVEQHISHHHHFHQQSAIVSSLFVKLFDDDDGCIRPRKKRVFYYAFNTEWFTRIEKNYFFLRHICERAHFILALEFFRCLHCK